MLRKYKKVLIYLNIPWDVTTASSNTNFTTHISMIKTQFPACSFKMNCSGSVESWYWLLHYLLVFSIKSWNLNHMTFWLNLCEMTSVILSALLSLGILQWMQKYLGGWIKRYLHNYICNRRTTKLYLKRKIISCTVK